MKITVCLSGECHEFDLEYETFYEVLESFKIVDLSEFRGNLEIIKIEENQFDFKLSDIQKYSVETFCELIEIYNKFDDQDKLIADMIFEETNLLELAVDVVCNEKYTFIKTNIDLTDLYNLGQLMTEYLVRGHFSEICDKYFDYSRYAEDTLKKCIVRRDYNLTYILKLDSEN